MTRGDRPCNIIGYQQWRSFRIRLAKSIREIDSQLPLHNRKLYTITAGSTTITNTDYHTIAITDTTDTADITNVTTCTITLRLDRALGRSGKFSLNSSNSLNIQKVFLLFSF